MNFLVNYFQKSIHASGIKADIENIDAIVSKWESRLEVSLVDAIEAASKEAVSEEVVVEESLAAEVVEDNFQVAKEIKKQAYLSAASLRKSIKKNPSKSNLKQLTDLENFIAEFLMLTDLGVILKTQELQASYK